MRERDVGVFCMWVSWKMVITVSVCVDYLAIALCSGLDKNDNDG